MPDPAPHPQARLIRRVGLVALLAGIVIMLMKLGVFVLTGSAAVLSDALESIINIAAAAIMLYSIWLANRPADAEHPYGHGKVEFLTLGLEGAMVLTAGIVIAGFGVRRLITPVELTRPDLGAWLLLGVNLLNAGLAIYVFVMGKRSRSPVLIADGLHLLTDVGSTLGAIIGLLLVQWTGILRLDPIMALVLGFVIVMTAGRLLKQSLDGLMDRTDPHDQKLIEGILQEEVRHHAIHGFHKVRHRHNGTFHWVDMHLQVDADLTVAQGHALASRIEYRVEQALGQANVTAHIEPADRNETSTSNFPTTPTA